MQELQSRGRRRVRGLPRISELEGFVLGLIWQFQPCCAYDLRCHLKACPSTQWSASTGAIYPLTRRLQNDRLIKGESKPKGKRARQMYAITQRGLRALRHWIGPPVPNDAITVTHDPLRARARFITALPMADRQRWIEHSLATLHKVDAIVTEWHDRYSPKDAIAKVITRSGRLDLDVRRQWLTELSRIL